MVPIPGTIICASKKTVKQNFCSCKSKLKKTQTIFNFSLYLLDPDRDPYKTCGSETFALTSAKILNYCNFVNLSGKFLNFLRVKNNKTEQKYLFIGTWDPDPV